MNNDLIWLNREPHYKNLRINPGIRHISRLHVKPRSFQHSDPKTKTYVDDYQGIQIKIVENYYKVHPQALMLLNSCKSVFSSQLPNMEISYIVRQIFDYHCYSVTILREGTVISAITSRLFPEKDVNFLEIIFVSVLSEYQSGGYGRLIMNYLKQLMQSIECYDAITCADNDAVKYFCKQGFNTEKILMNPNRWIGRIKDYNGVTTSYLHVDPYINYYTFNREVRLQMKSLENRYGKRFHIIPPELLDTPPTDLEGRQSIACIPLEKLYQLTENSSTDKEFVQAKLEEYNQKKEALLEQLKETVEKCESQLEITKSNSNNNNSELFAEFTAIKRRLRQSPDYYKSIQMLFGDLYHLSEFLKRSNKKKNSFISMLNSMKKDYGIE
ncbi:acetyltransferase, GNAT family protein [Trichomonas vaginalis G3]|uniref:Acetyltransferase, GNAT family protein n=1 Tax=Trichomonas vaginalis (strain ATCC PRA-98 / G3) TaxID=412133 RepID=A2ERK7_TRIV3|nr:histone acetyltransferase protein [Trichomonas vaginalis G3]EAY04734.1 acetyltransferase, GNAT family protein [Trichomonas vaginalis G3]KAI5526842.1 histone acetyltransferase protein [Trichomonas vaginalis G3]|eukprot:XP_001316957.1 acetyltransferase, GNAT family protein [Trichomonas vaginalis G3]